MSLCPYRKDPVPCEEKDCHTCWIYLLYNGKVKDYEKIKS
jgi:hypothetical protein